MTVHTLPIRRRAKGSGVAFEPPPSAEDRLRILLPMRERAEKELREIDAMIAAESRRYADEKGEFLRPTVEQLKRRIGGAG